ncbi:hypothetical protein FACS1894152_4530 [Bacilli bacterium]|nr:hypothetical protein FACS1894152_4530 [Bacilli bacterium]GHU31237.1 hypothetical protein FACS1894166_02300 [Bacilli bacterium]
MTDLMKAITNEIKTEESKETVSEINVAQNINNGINDFDDFDGILGQFNVKVFGVGGAGCNVVDFMLKSRP